MESRVISTCKKIALFEAIILIFVLSVCESQSGKEIRFADPRATYVILYEHESFRGGEYVANFGKSCVNLPEKYTNWASSVDSHRSCASVCGSRDCQGKCVNVYSRQGVSKLRLIGLNDQIQSVKACYT